MARSAPVPHASDEPRAPQVGLRPWVALGLVLAAFETGWIAFAIGRPLLLPDEPREAAITLEMARSGAWTVPTLNDHPFVEKPPLPYAASALACWLTGSEAVGVLRLPQLVATLATLATLFALGRHLDGAAAGMTCALLLATTAEFFRTSLRLVVDPELLAWTSGAVLATVEWWLAERPAARAGWWVATCACLALAVATKGPVALAYHGSVALALLVFGGMPGLGRLPGLVAAYLVSLSPLGAWALALFARGGWDLVSEALLRNSWGRFTQAELGHRAPLWFYLKVLPVALAPWTLLALAGLGTAWHSAREAGIERGRATVLRAALGWAAGSLLVLSASAAKRELYLLPALPGWTLFAGAALSDAARAHHLEGLPRFALLTTLAALAGASLAGSFLLLGQGHTEAALLLLPALLFGVFVGVAWRRWPAFANAVLFAAVALAAGGAAPWLMERDAARGSIEAARSTLTQAGDRADRVYGVGLRERDVSVLSLALRRRFTELDDLGQLGGPGAPLARRTLVVSGGTEPPVLGPTLLEGVSVEGADSAPLGSQRLFFSTLVKRE
ncbi:MAG TPA: glycosyltransferase family 39 protein [Myxococcota bacterium]|nr:glycosyltransferase family 39 protein [Myxococcota bacterium]